MGVVGRCVLKLLLECALVSVCPRLDAQTVVLGGSFTGNTLDSGWTVGGSGFTPVLTASSAGGNIDSSGSGWLRLTSAGGNQATYAYDTTSFVSKNATITASFNYVSYGGTGADGITFFLADASKTFGVGAYGGSLGYAQKTVAGDGGADINGMNGGYIGLGIDEFGNYSNPTEGREGGIGFYADNVSVRGPGDGLTGYDYLGGTGSLPTSLDSPGSGTRPTETTYKIVITATNQLTVFADFGATGNFVTLYSIDLSGYARPDELIMGFTGSTGGSTNIHEVQNVALSSVVANLWTNAEGDSKWGTGNDWYGDPSGQVPESYADVLLDNTYVDSAQTIDVATNRIIRSLQIDAPFGYTLNNGALTFNDGGIAGPVGIFVSQTHGSATHTINSALSLNQDIEIKNNSAGSLNLGGNVATGGHEIAFDGSGVTTLTGVVSGSGSIAQTGTGTTTLSGNNTYSGGTAITAGRLNANHANALGSGTVGLAGGNLGSTNASSVNNTISLTASSGLSGITTTGTLTQTGGSYTLAMDGATHAGGLNLSNNNTGRTLTVQVADGTSTISGVIANGGSSAGNLTKTGTGKLVLSGNNTFSGSLDINEGTVSLGGSDRLSDSVDVTISSSGVFDLNGFSERIDNLTASGGGASINFGSSSGANTLLFDYYTAPSSGVLIINNWEDDLDVLATRYNNQDSINDGGIYISGYGVADYDGTVNVYGGSRYLLRPVIATEKEWDGSDSDEWTNNKDNNWTTPGEPSTTQIALFDDLGIGRSTVSFERDDTIAGIRFGAGATVGYTINGNNSNRTLTLTGTVPYIQQQSAQTQTINIQRLTLGATTVADITGAGDLVLNSSIRGTAALIKDGNGAGKLVLGGSTDSIFTGGVYINNGIVEARKDSALGTGATTIYSGATLQLSNNIDISENITLSGVGVGGDGAINNLSGDNELSGNLSLTAATRVESAQDTLDISGTVTGSGRTLTLGGAGNINLSGVVGTGTGGVTVDGTGTVTLSGNSANTYTGDTTVTGGTLALSKSNNTVAVAGDLVIAGGAVSQTASGQIGASTTVTLTAGSYTLSGSGSVNQTIRKMDTSTGTTVSIGTSDTLTLSGSGVSNINGVISGDGSLVTAGTGSVYLGGANTYTGGSTIGSVVTAANSASLGDGAVAINSGGNLQVQGGISMANNFTLNGTGTGSNDGTFQNIAGNNAVTGGVTLAGNTRIQSDSGTLTLAGNTALGTRTLNVGGSGNTTLSGVVSGTGTTAITKDGTGTLTLAGSSANTFSGGLQLNHGTVVLNKGAGTNAIANGPITVGDGVGAYDSATLRWAQSNQLPDSATITLNSDGALDLNGRSETLAAVNGNGHIMIGTGQLIVGSGDADMTFSGVLSGSDGGVFTKTGDGTLTFSSDTRNGGEITFGGEFNLNGGTLALDDIDFTVATLRLTGDAIIDFGGNSTLTVGTLIIELGAGQQVTITSWEEWMDYFYADSVQNGDGTEIPDFDTRGDAPLNHIVFAGWNGSNTKWAEWNNEITPVPEPAETGALLVGGLVGLVAFRRRLRA